MSRAIVSAYLGMIAVLSHAAAQAPVPDFTDVDLVKAGIKPVAPKKDPRTGFVVGGVNSTDLIEKLTEINGKSIAELEKVMRPGASSRAGFLGKDEKLLAVLAADNRFVVEKMGLSHQEIARHLHALGVIAAKQASAGKSGQPFRYQGRRFRAEFFATLGFQDSPFGDGTKSGSDVTVHNLDNGKKLRYALLVPYMIERYGFYEGKGTPYRVEPAKVLEVLDFIKGKAKS
jgi:hypothetical protein